MKLLLVRLRQIGDVVFTTPSFAALKDYLPGSHLTYIVEPSAAPVVANNPLLDAVIVAPRTSGPSGFLNDLALGRRLARQHFDVAIDFHGGPRAALLTWMSRAPRRIGYQIAGRSWMYTTRVARPRELRARHSVENQWDLLSALGVPAPSRTRYPVQMPLDPSAAAHVRARLATLGVGDGSRIVVMHVSAGNPFRRWPLDSFAQVAASLVSLNDTLHVVVTSGPSEVEAASLVIRLARERVPALARARVLDCGDFSLTELRALVDTAALYVGGDSGPMHVAATSHVPVVSLYGPTLPARSEPWRATAPSAFVEVLDLPCRPCEQRVCEPGDFRCLTRISAADVVEQATRLLGRTG